MLPRRSGRVLAAGAMTLVFVFVALFLVVPVGKDKRGEGRIVPADATMVRADASGTLEWVAAVGTPLSADDRVATIGGGASRRDIAVARARAHASLVDHLRLPAEDRFAAAVPEAIRALRAEQARVGAGALSVARAGEVLLRAAQPGDAVEPGDLIAVVGRRDAPLELRVRYPADASPSPRPGDALQFRWGARAEQWASFEITEVSYMAASREGSRDASRQGAAPPSLQLVAVVDPAHATRLRPGLAGEVELAGHTETMAQLMWSNLAGVLDLQEAP